MRKFKNLTVIFAVLIAVAILPAVSPKAEAAGDSLSIYVAYLGQGAGVQYFDKAVLSRSELEAIGTQDYTYTSIDRGRFCAYADAVGVQLDEIMYSAGVDLDAAYQLNFCTSDHPDLSSGGYTSLSIGYLFGTQRYSFPSLSEYYGVPEGGTEKVITDYDALWASATVVPAVLALEDNYKRIDNDFQTYTPGETPLSSEKSLRLFFGQSRPDEVISGNYAQYVQSIVVYFAVPLLKADDSELELKVGSDHKINVSVPNSDSLLEQDLLSKLRWESSDSSIVSVDANGQLTVKGKGDVTITVYADGYKDSVSNTLSTQIHITVGEDENTDGGGGGGDGAGTGTGDGDGSGTGNSGTGTGGGTSDTGDGSGGGNTGTDSGTGNNGTSNSTTDNGASNQNSTDKQPTVQTQNGTDTNENTEDVYINPNETSSIPNNTSKLKVRRLYLSLSGSSNSTSGGQAGEESGSSSGGSENVVLSITENPLTLFAAITAIILLLAGAVATYIDYRNQLRYEARHVRRRSKLTDAQK